MRPTRALDPFVTWCRWHDLVAFAAAFTVVAVTAVLVAGAALPFAKSQGLVAKAARAATKATFRGCVVPRQARVARVAVVLDAALAVVTAVTAVLVAVAVLVGTLLLFLRFGGRR